jgi:hypothetical protein
MEQDLTPPSPGTFEFFFKQLLSQGLRATQEVLGLTQLPILLKLLFSDR